MKVYNSSVLNIPVDNIGYPYFFVLHDDLTLTDVFVPNKLAQNITATYLELVKNKYNFHGKF